MRLFRVVVGIVLSSLRAEHLSTHSFFTIDLFIIYNLFINSLAFKSMN